MTDKIQVAIFANATKKHEKSPDWSGEVTFPDGKKMEIALWNNQYGDGVNYYKGFINEKWTPTGSDSSQPRKNNAVKIDF